MNRACGWRKISLTAVMLVAAACGGTQMPPENKGSATKEFERCRQQEEQGPARGCWKRFLDDYGSTASSAEVMVAKEHAKESPKTAQAAPTAAPAQTEVPRQVTPPKATTPTDTLTQGTLTHETPVQAPPQPPVSASQPVTGNIVADLLAIPSPGSSAWDKAVESRLVREYDSNGSRKIDTDAELQKMPCQAWMALESRLWPAKNISVSRLYGFAPGFSWVGYVLGFAEPMRQKTFDRMKTCGVNPTHAPSPSQVPTASALSTATSSPGGLVAELAALPNAGSSEWDRDVKTRMLRHFDDDHSGEIERESELKKIPCNVLTTLESRLQSQRRISVARLYGFAPGFGWVGNALGFGQALREKAYAQMRSCGIDTGSPMPASSSSSPSSASAGGAILVDLIAIPDPGSSAWDRAVKTRMLREYDTNRNNEIDSDAELQRIPCTVFAALEVRLQGAQHISVSKLYGFAPGFAWVGNALGFAQSLREKAFSRMRTCNLP